MGWINDVKLEIHELNTSKDRLRKFAFLLGCIFLIIAMWMTFRHTSHFVYYVFGFLGVLLIASGILFPEILKGIYTAWMAMAFAIGWLVSRILLAAIFYFIVTPVGLTARLFGKKFLDTKMHDGQGSYWIKRDTNNKTDYEKMY